MGETLYWRSHGGAALAFLALTLALAGCDGATQAPTPTSTVNAEAAANAADAAIALETQRGCMTAALNNTVYKQQSDSDLEAALFAQDLKECPIDFIQSYVALRNAAKDYLVVARELTAHSDTKTAADENDWWNLGCSVLSGRQCVEWPSDVWNRANGEIKTRFEAAKAALASARGGNEQVAAGYGIYFRTADQPSNAQEKFKGLAPTENAM